MTLDSNVKVYETSKSSVPVTLEGEYVETGTVRNGRTQILHIESDKKYWTEPTVNEEEPAEVAVDAPIQISGTAIGHTPPTEAKPSYEVYVVGGSDNLFTISSKFGVSASVIKAINGTDKFTIGQRIRIPKG